MYICAKRSSIDSIFLCKAWNSSKNTEGWEDQHYCEGLACACSCTYIFQNNTHRASFTSCFLLLKQHTNIFAHMDWLVPKTNFSQLLLCIVVWTGTLFWSGRDIFNRLSNMSNDWFVHLCMTFKCMSLTRKLNGDILVHPGQNSYCNSSKIASNADASWLTGLVSSTILSSGAKLILFARSISTSIILSLHWPPLPLPLVEKTMKLRIHLLLTVVNSHFVIRM